MEVQLQNHCFKTDLYKSQLGMNYYFFETAHGDGEIVIEFADMSCSTHSVHISSLQYIHIYINK